MRAFSENNQTKNNEGGRETNCANSTVLMLAVGNLEMALKALFERIKVAGHGVVLQTSTT